MENNNKHTSFDAQIRAALDAFETPYNAEHWAAMSANLDALDAEEADFDRSLRSRLSGIEPSFAPLNWEKLSDKLDDLDKSDEAFDETLKEKFAQLQANYRPNHWKMMSERLDYEFSWRSKIVRYKIAELALMLLTFFTVGNAIDRFDTEGGNVEIKNYELKIVEPSANNSANNSAAPDGFSPSKSLNKNAPTSNDNKSVKSFNSPNWRERPRNSSPNDAPKSEFLPIGKPVVSAGNRENTEGSSLIEKKNLDIKNAQNDVAFVEKLPLKTVEKVLPQAENDAQNSTNSAADAVAEVLNPMPILQPNPLKINDLNEMLKLPKLNAEKKSRWRIGVSLASATDWISTSFLRNRALEKQTQIAPNAGVTVSIGYHRGKWEAETGVNFHAKKYELPNVEVISGNFLRSGYVVESPKNLRLSIISIPLNIGYHFHETRRWDMSLQAGFAANSVLDAYEIRDLATTASNFSTRPPTVSNIELPEYSSGILHGDKIQDMTYLTASVGVGVAYRLSPRTSVFLQSSLESHVSKQGVGTLNDRINSVNIQGGAKWRL